MTHTRSPKRVVFEPDTVEISDISTRKLISEGVTNHISKEYEFLCFFPYSDSFQDLQLIKREGKSILPKLFEYDDVSYDYSGPQFEDEDQVESDIDIKDEFNTSLDRDPISTSYPRPKWANKVFEVVGNMVGDSSRKRRTKYEFQYENLTLCHTYPLVIERCYKLLDR